MLHRHCHRTMDKTLNIKKNYFFFFTNEENTEEMKRSLYELNVNVWKLWYKPDPPKKKEHTTLVDRISLPTCSGSHLLLLEATSLFSLHCLIWICADTKLHSKIIFQELPWVTRQIWSWLLMVIKEQHLKPFSLP